MQRVSFFLPPSLARLQTHQSLPPSHDAFLTIVQANLLGSRSRDFFLGTQQRSLSTVQSLLTPLLTHPTQKATRASTDAL